ncbi:hypothetical protein JTE90_004612 [Oedothorax gibbosus]|uniref:Uncharacterized protein n=1 Tax=Oedothorax gibbosus TaxID=931172 RepID=A0AAV6UPX6_9ARAC|nr:hypothetical protein JTE90_004612 [Oedothorax gibbosus]
MDSKIQKPEPVPDKPRTYFPLSNPPDTNPCALFTEDFVCCSLLYFYESNDFLKRPSPNPSTPPIPDGND